MAEVDLYKSSIHTHIQKSRLHPPLHPRRSPPRVSRVLLGAPTRPALLPGGFSELDFLSYLLRISMRRWFSGFVD
ncbi:hypothetical protein CRG98_041620 [Punica granatum]|uniref:Uncharacterized protein n=1 Tax=Punica granatum TaxID=22663 RepID=A0A2I0I201_PUNGR|nr:hypothetical protein CRG98_041620 [Punica granatum]